MSLVVDIRKTLGNFRLDAAFEAECGTSGLLGASGCGKSVTLKCIAGIETPDDGHIELDGRTLFDSAKKIDLPPQRRMVGYLFQNYALFPNMTVRQNILCGLNREKDRGERERALAQIIGMMGLQGFEKHRPAQLSGGQQQRAALARILVSRPRLLMLDEPFSALDSGLRERLQIEMKGLLSGFEGTSLLVTHNRDEAYRVCGRIALMENGRILTTRPTKKLFEDPGSVAAAELTGCRNIARAIRTDEFEAEVPEWGVRLKTAVPVRDGLRAVGIHAHDFRLGVAENRFPLRLGEAVEEPFGVLAPFRFIAQSADSPELWWSFPKGKTAYAPDAQPGVSPENILLLYE